MFVDGKGFLINVDELFELPGFVAMCTVNMTRPCYETMWPKNPRWEELGLQNWEVILRLHGHKITISMHVYKTGGDFYNRFYLEVLHTFNALKPFGKKEKGAKGFCVDVDYCGDTERLEMLRNLQTKLESEATNQVNTKTIRNLPLRNALTNLAKNHFENEYENPCDWYAKQILRILLQHSL